MLISFATALPGCGGDLHAQLAGSDLLFTVTRRCSSPGTFL
jgi:hypothetical protein